MSVPKRSRTFPKRKKEKRKRKTHIMESRCTCSRIDTLSSYPLFYLRFSKKGRKRCPRKDGRMRRHTPEVLTAAKHGRVTTWSSKTEEVLCHYLVVPRRGVCPTVALGQTDLSTLQPRLKRPQHSFILLLNDGFSLKLAIFLPNVKKCVLHYFPPIK